FLLFFFSVSILHTSFSRDWSSDVCSSDLFVEKSSSFVFVLLLILCRSAFEQEFVTCYRHQQPSSSAVHEVFILVLTRNVLNFFEIGRASCRERVLFFVVACSVLEVVTGHI